MHDILLTPLSLTPNPGNIPRVEGQASHLVFSTGFFSSSQHGCTGHCSTAGSQQPLKSFIQEPWPVRELRVPCGARQRWARPQGCGSSSAHGQGALGRHPPRRKGAGASRGSKHLSEQKRDLFILPRTVCHPADAQQNPAPLHLPSQSWAFGERLDFTVGPVSRRKREIRAELILPSERADAPRPSGSQVCSSLPRFAGFRRGVSCARATRFASPLSCSGALAQE